MLFKRFNLIYHYPRLIPKYTNNLFLHNSIKKCSSTINKTKFIGPSLKDFIANDSRVQQTEFLNDDEKIPYVDIVDLGQNRKGKRF